MMSEVRRVKGKENTFEWKLGDLKGEGLHFSPVFQVNGSRCFLSAASYSENFLGKTCWGFWLNPPDTSFCPFYYKVSVVDHKRRNLLTKKEVVEEAPTHQQLIMFIDEKDLIENKLIIRGALTLRVTLKQTRNARKRRQHLAAGKTSRSSSGLYVGFRTVSREQNSSQWTLQEQNSSGWTLPEQNSSPWNLPKQNSSQWTLPEQNSSPWNLPKQNSSLWTLPEQKSSQWTLPEQNSSPWNLPKQNSSLWTLPEQKYSPWTLPEQNSSPWNYSPKTSLRSNFDPSSKLAKPFKFTASSDIAGSWKPSQSRKIPNSVTRKNLWCNNVIEKSRIKSSEDDDSTGNSSSISEHTTKSESSQPATNTSTSSDEEPNKLSETVSNNFGAFSSIKTGTDCVIKTEEMRYLVHRAVMSARSAFFSAIQCDTAENCSEVNNSPLKATDLCNILYYIYSGKIQELTSDTAAFTYTVADKDALLELKRKCLDILNLKLTVNNIYDAIFLAHVHGNSELQQNILLFIENRLEELVQSEKWKEILSLRPICAYRLLSSAFLASRKRHIPNKYEK